MSYLKVPILLLCLSTFNNFVEDWFNLDFVHDYPIKIDGGCSFFTFDTTDLSKKSYIMVIDKNKLAFIEKDGKFKYLKHIKRVLKPNGYIDYFGDGSYKITLDLSKVRLLNDGSNELKGSLKISNNNKNKIIAIHGINEEYHLFK